MKRFNTVIISLVAFASMASAQKTFSILGDSYSTFEGYITPSWNAPWYAEPESNIKHENDVKSVDKTWWRLLDATEEYDLDTNNSWSGTTVCLTGYYKKDNSAHAFITRYMNLGNPDIILVFGGTNDSWAGVEIGDYQYAGWQKSDLYRFRPALAYLFAQLKAMYPNALICNISHDELKPEIIESMNEICAKYDVKNIFITNMDKQSGHPSIAGMQTIYQTIFDALGK